MEGPTTCIDAALYVYFMAHGLEVYRNVERFNDSFLLEASKNKDASSVFGSWFVLCFFWGLKLIHISHHNLLFVIISWVK